MGHKIGTVFMSIGAALILAALSLFLWNYYEDRQAGKQAEEILLKVVEEIEDGDTDEEIDGNSYIGFLSIPALGLELPVMSDWSDSQLKISPCRYSGSAATNDLVIAAHNYRQHFANIKNLSVGDEVYFTDMNGLGYLYEVSELDTLASTAVEEMTSGDYDLTLFTCTYGGRSRMTVRCMRGK